MTSVPADLKYTDDHEWIRIETGGIVAVGITDHAQKNLGDIVFFELPEVGRKVEAGDPVGTVESVKAASEIYCPVNGEILHVNDEVTDDPTLANSEPYDAWLFKIRTDGKAHSNGLLDSQAYEKLVSGE
ncbi:glycine cleavage system protein GcvH [Streptomyces scabiei]|uniref:glycine cleavage system protein GcvH n=1 Tax=Streptomyces scabiei TaxID=1930 RepID=UPI0038F7397F